MHSLIDRYRERLPVSAKTPVVSLGEGSTPLLRAPRISRRLGVELHLKWEGANPTGSFKDRGMTVAISRAAESGAQAVICASTGNTAASAAAYAARAGLAAVVLQPAGAVASGKLAQARALGARVLEVRGSFDEALSAARALSDRGTHVLVNSLNPDRLDGQKTAAFEIGEELGTAPDVLALPYGGGGNVTAYARGFVESEALPRLVAGEAVERTTTVASAIRIGTPAHAATVTAALEASDGVVVSLTDEAIIRAWRELAHAEGVFCEPSSAAGLAALEHVELEPGSTVVCVVTGHGLKDPESAARLSPEPVAVEPDPDAIEAASR
jgi:threonine synthase